LLAMTRKFAAPLLLALLAGCSGMPRPINGPAAPAAAAAPVVVKIIGLNDFHGNLEPPRQSVEGTLPSGETVRIPVGGAAYLASAVERYRAKNPNTLVVAAGDLIGASPITSSMFLDEPTIGAMNRIGLDFNAVGNHEFDRGSKELLRMQGGGCEKFTVREPCQVEKPFDGAKFKFLAANVLTDTGNTLFPATGLRTFGSGPNAVTVGLIGLTLKDTPTLVSPSGVSGLTFRDEAETINALVPQLKAQGAAAIVVMIHQGLSTKVGANDKSCGGVSGDLLPVLAKLDPRVDLVISGHTHKSYVCDHGQIDPERRFLVTSAGMAAQYFTDIDLTIDPVTKRVVGRRADNIILQSEPFTNARGGVELQPAFEQFPARPDVAAYIKRYTDAVQTLKDRAIGKASDTARKPATATSESQLGNLIADAQLAATKASGAQIALMNNSGVRADLLLDANNVVTFGAIFAIQPFANELKTLTLTGEELKQLLEQQFDGVGFDQAFAPSSTLSYAIDLSRPLGSRVFEILVEGKPIDPAADYRVTTNSFLASGGDNFTMFRKGRDMVTTGQDLEALEQWFAAVPVRTLPALGRVKNMSPAAAN
jgi:5'-nucleotidase